MSIKKRVLLPLLAILAGATACQSLGFMTGRPVATCTLAPLGASTGGGKVTFTEQSNGILVEAELTGLSPGKHGIHIHEHGDCSDNGEAAGGHFDPGHAMHGRAAMAMSHEGDLGNVVADASGYARMSVVDPWLKLSGDHGILGRSVIVHAAADDLASQPGGNAGARIACGLINATAR